MAQQEQLPEVASRIFTACKKCGVDRYQTVLAHATSKSAKLECEVCHTKNTFKLASAKKASGAKKSRAAAVAVNRWEEVKALINEKDKKSYNMRVVFTKDMTIEHPKFGVGVVTATQAHSIEVVFADATRSLVHNRT